MLNELDNLASKQLAVSPRNIPLALNDDATVPLSLKLPPFEELLNIRSLADFQVSIKHVVSDVQNLFREHFDNEFKRLKQKEPLFGESTTYLNHLANLAELSGEAGVAESYLRRALEFSPDAFFVHRLEGNLLLQQNNLALEEFISARQENLDYEDLLLGAYGAVLRGNYLEALARSDRALKIDPLEPRGRMLAGALSLYGREYEKAIQNFRIAAEDRPNSSALFLNLAIAYYCIGSPTKSEVAARRAILINPLDQNAVSFYADLTLHQGRPKDAIPALEKLVRYEQKAAGIWSRLARAYYFSERLDDAVRALKQQAAIEPSPNAWNNLGVVYAKKRETHRAIQFYEHALRNEAYRTQHAAQLALVNLLLLLNDSQRYNEVIGIARPLVESGEADAYASKKELEGFFVSYLKALTLTGHGDQAASVAESWLGNAHTCSQLRVSLLASLLAQYSVYDPRRDYSLKYAHWALRSIEACGDCEPGIASALVNNIAFAFVEFGELQEAQHLLPLLAKAVHVDPYSTATLGLYHLRKDDLVRGESLYREAIALSANQRVRDSIRQKMSLELGRVYLKRGDNRLARRYLEKASHAKHSPVPALSKQAQALLHQLS